MPRPRDGQRTGDSLPGRTIARPVPQLRSADGSPCVAILCSDIHLSHRPPLARACEDDWYGVQAGYLQQVFTLAGDVGKPRGMRGVPIVIAGDIFDKPQPPVELVNFALRQ